MNPWIVPPVHMTGERLPLATGADESMETLSTDGYRCRLGSDPVFVEGFVGGDCG